MALGSSDKAAQWLECVTCGQRYPVSPMFFGCLECEAEGPRAPLEMRYDYEATAGFASEPGISGIWRWRRLLPDVDGAEPVTLGEGNTPLCDLPAAGVRLLLKNETMNPTWSYKDRASAVNATVARGFGFTKMGAVSTGNLGNSTAAYASAAGLNCTVFCHEDASATQVDLIRLYGATVVLGGPRTERLRALVEGGGWFPSYLADPIAGFADPFGVEGYKTIAYEIVSELGGSAPDRVFAPLAGGDGLYGIWKGFVELQKVGIVDRPPRMFGVQADGANPYVRSFNAGEREVRSVSLPRTMALSIAEHTGGRQALWALYDSQGAAVSVSETEILDAIRRTALSGLALEPASAAAVAGARKVLANERARGETWVVIGTGALVKWPETFEVLFPLPGVAAIGEDHGKIQNAPRPV